MKTLIAATFVAIFTVFAAVPVLADFSTERRTLDLESPKSRKCRVLVITGEIIALSRDLGETEYETYDYLFSSRRKRGYTEGGLPYLLSQVLSKIYDLGLDVEESGRFAYDLCMEYPLKEPT